MEMTAHGAVGKILGNSLEADTAVTPTTANSSQELTIPSPTSPSLQVCWLPFFPPSLTLPGCPLVEGLQLFACYFSSVCSPQQPTPNTRGPCCSASGLSDHIFRKGDLALAKPKLLSLLLIELDFIRKSMEGCPDMMVALGLSLPYLLFLRQMLIQMLHGSHLQLSLGTVC